MEVETNQKRSINEFAIAGLTMGVLSFVNLIGFEKAIIAIVFSLLGWRAIKKSNERGTWLAIAGMILGSLAIALTAYMAASYWPEIMQMIRQDGQL